MRRPYTTREFTMLSEAMGREVSVRIEGNPGSELFMVEVDGEWLDAYDRGLFSWEDFMDAESRGREPADTCHHGN